MSLGPSWPIEVPEARGCLSSETTGGTCRSSRSLTSHLHASSRFFFSSDSMDRADLTPGLREIFLDGIYNAEELCIMDLSSKAFIDPPARRGRGARDRR